MVGIINDNGSHRDVCSSSSSSACDGSMASVHLESVIIN